MKKIYQYILMAVAVVATASCSNELDEALQPANNGTLQFVVSDFPMFGEGIQTRVIGTQDEGKTAWENGDQIIITLTSERFGEQTTAITYDGTNWGTEVSLSYLENEIPTVSAVYAPCYEVTVEGVKQLRSGMQLGMCEYLEADCEIQNGTINISFADALRTYSRLRIAGLSNQTLTITTTDFTPAGATFVATEPYTLTNDEKGNAYLYGIFAEGATVNVKKGDVTLTDYTFTFTTELIQSYVLDARPVIKLWEYNNGETVEITDVCIIYGDGDMYDISLNIVESTTVIFDAGTSGVKLSAPITVADGKTLTLRIEGDAEHTVNGGISLGNSSNVIIEGDLTKENNKLTVTATDGNAGIGANNGVTAGDITIRNARVDATGSSKEAPEIHRSTSISGAAIGTSDGSMGNILIENSIIIAEGGYYESSSHAAAIGIGYVGSTMGDITLKDSQITATNKGDGLATVIGAGWNHYVFDVVGTLGDIVITNTDLNLSMVISIENLYGAFIGPGFINSNAYVNMGKIIFTDMTQAELDEMIATWKDPNDFYEWAVYALGKEYKDCAFGGVWVSDGADGLVRIDDGNGYYNPE